MKGIDPRARAIAKSAARREGMTLGEWLNRVILDDGISDAAKTWDDQLSNFPGFGGGGGGDDDDQLAELIGRLSDRLEAVERRSTLALSGVDQSVLALSRRLETLEDGFEDTDEESREALQRARAQQDELLERVRRLERSGGGGADPAALKAVETTVGKLATRLYETERDVRTELDTLAHKDERRRDSAERGLEKLGQRVEESEKRQSDETRALRDMIEARETRTTGQLETLQDGQRSLQSRIIAAENATQRAAEALIASQEKLDARLRLLEASAGDSVKADDVQRRFDALAREVADVIRDTRTECARQIAEVSRTTDLPRLEKALADAEARLSAAETRQSEALQRIGTEVGRLARAVDQRLDRTERRLQKRLDEAETARQARSDRTDIEARLDKLRADNTQAVRRIGEQVAKLGESLTDRVSQAEQRSAQAVEAAGEKMAQVVERIEQSRNSAGEQDLDARIRASEERTAQRIDQAMRGVHERLDLARSETSEALSPVQRAMTALAERLEAIESQGKSRKSENADEAAEAVREASDAIDDFSRPLPEAPLLAPDAWVETGETPAPKAARSDAFEITSAPQGDALAASVEPQPAPRRTAAPGATADADFLARARKQVRANRGGEAGWTPPAAEPAGGQSRTVLIGASALGFVAVAAAAGMLALEAVNGGGEQIRAQSDPAESLSSLFAEPVQTASADPMTAPVSVSADTSATARPEQLEAGPAVEPDAVATPAPETARAPQTPPASAPQPAAPARPSLQDAAASGDPVARYQLAMQQLEAQRFADAAALMRRAAEQGVPAAQRRYAQMLSAGEGVAANPAAARDWMTRAAENGHVLAMHDAGGMYINAEDVPENQAAAARWFEQAALHGVRDSQFNMALLFQEGFGVPQSPADAYAWFLIAAAGGDNDAAARAAGLRPELTPEQRAAAESVAQTFTPRESDPEAQGIYPPQAWDAGGAQAQLAEAQRLLSTLGYTPGPADGLMGARTREAIEAFQRAQGLPVTGAVDPALLARLERAAAG